MEWYALYRVDPWGERRDDMRAAMSTMQLVASRMTKKQAGSLKFKDFLYTPPIDVEPQNDAAIEAKAMMWAKTRNAANTKGKVK